MAEDLDLQNVISAVLNLDDQVVINQALPVLLILEKRVPGSGRPGALKARIAAPQDFQRQGL
jgi:hypothetical protein